METSSRESHKSYTKIGLVHLSSEGLMPSLHEYKIQPFQETENPIASFILEKFIKPQIMQLDKKKQAQMKQMQKQKQKQQSEDCDDESQAGDDASSTLIGSIVAIPANGDVNNMDFLQGSFAYPSSESDQDAMVGNMLETIGCLVDCIILFYDTKCPHRQTAIVRLVKGLERQRASNASSSREGKDIHILILARDDDDNAMEELYAIRNVLSETETEGDENSKLGDMIQIVPIKLHISSKESKSELGVFKTIRTVLAQVADQSLDHTEFVPMDEFPKFAKRVYSKLGGRVDDESSEFSMEMRRLGTSLHLHASEKLQFVVERKLEEFAGVLEEKLMELEAKQDGVLLDDQKMPILEFGRDASDILSIASNALNTNEVRSHILGLFDGDYVLEQRGKFIDKVNENVRRLFDNQLQSLREYYGKRYENIIAKLEEDDDVDILDLDEDEVEQRRIKHDTILADEAKKSTEGFRTAADNAIPSFVKKEEMKELAAGYNYAVVLEGLIRDMLKATLDSQSLEDEWGNVNGNFDGEEEDGLPAKTRRGPVKWYEKLAARGLVFGVNYLQGWLAYQGIKKSAEERDRMMPKFPLF